MNGKKNEKRTIVALVAVLLFMAVGFAAFSTTLFIGGSSADGSTVTVKRANWSVHYVSDPTSLNESSTIKATTKTLTNTDYSFTVQLNKVGDVYDASWTVKNDGTVQYKHKIYQLPKGLVLKSRSILVKESTYGNVKFFD